MNSVNENLPADAVDGGDRDARDDAEGRRRRTEGAGPREGSDGSSRRRAPHVGVQRRCWPMRRSRSSRRSSPGSSRHFKTFAGAPRPPRCAGALPVAIDRSEAIRRAVLERIADMRTRDANYSATLEDKTTPRLGRRRWPLAMSIAVGLSAGIHLFVVGEHLQGWWVSGVFFVAAGIAQAFCAFTILRSGSRGAATAGAVVSAGLVLVWTISRTAGIPFGPHAGTREAAGGLDLIATAAEGRNACRLRPVPSADKRLDIGTEDLKPQSSRSSRASLRAGNPVGDRCSDAFARHRPIGCLTRRSARC